MASLIERNGVTLFVSYAPGTASTSLEQFIRTHHDFFSYHGAVVTHFPEEEYGINSKYSRHVTYREYLAAGMDGVEFVVAGVRNPFSYYFAEYNRILEKWLPLLAIPDSWIYDPRSKSTLDLALRAMKVSGFDEWFLDILKGQESVGYMVINGDHLDGATHFVSTENIFRDFSGVVSEVLGMSIDDLGVHFPRVNVGSRENDYSREISSTTKELALRLFYSYMKKFDYQY